MNLQSNDDQPQSLLQLLDTFIRLTRNSNVLKEAEEMLDVLRTFEQFHAMAPLVPNAELFPYSDRRKQDVIEKENIAAYLADSFTKLSKTHKTSGWFLGAGTTIATLGKEISERCRNGEEFKPPFVVTNNLLVSATLACHMASTIRQVGGYPCRQYAATLPINENDATEFIKHYAEDFEIFSSEVAKCRIAITSCTRFSFLFGPLVNTTQNAVAKRAVFHAATDAGRRAKVLVPFAVKKIIPFSIQLDKRFDANHSSLTSVFPSVDDDQICIKTLPLEITNSTSQSRQWYKNISDGDIKMKRIKPLITGISKHGSNQAVSDSIPWRNYSCDLTLLIGIPNQDRRAWIEALKHEVNEANAFFKQVLTKVKEASQPSEQLRQYEFTGERDGCVIVKMKNAS